MADKKLVLVTNNFPYGKGEEFLENEIWILSKKFRKIYIFTFSKNVEITRKLPSNVCVRKISRDKKKYLIKLFNLKNILMMLKERRYKLDDLKRILKYILLGKKLQEEIKKLQKEERIKDKSLICYSYWLTIGAYGLTFLPKEIKKISRAHGHDIYEEVNPNGYLPFRDEIFNKLNLIIPCSNNGKEYLLKNKCLTDKVFVSYLGTTNQKLNVEKSKVNERVIISCSSINRNKRVERIAEMFNEFQNNFPSSLYIKWIHFGSGKEEKEIIEFCKNNIQNIDIEFRGHVKNSELLKFYRENNVDLFINVSKSEGIPVSMMEAQSFGIPIIGTNVGGVNEITNESLGGLLPKDFTNRELFLKINELLKKDTLEILKIRQRNYNNWNKKFNAEKDYDEFIEKYLY